MIKPAPNNIPLVAFINVCPILTENSSNVFELFVIRLLIVSKPA